MLCASNLTFQLLLHFSNPLTLVRSLETMCRIFLLLLLSYRCITGAPYLTVVFLQLDEPITHYNEVVMAEHFHSKSIKYFHISKRSWFPLLWDQFAQDCVWRRTRNFCWEHALVLLLICRPPASSYTMQPMCYIVMCLIVWIYSIPVTVWKRSLPRLLWRGPHNWW